MSSEVRLKNVTPLVNGVVEAPHNVCHRETNNLKKNRPDI